ncbi:tyrosine-protein phosphatase [Kitasatospora sp. NPDC057015]|uniref:tyrosine-protein phosphatase n=1 Tax=Kitasatospora sp. NPDC057015 TaxID=3346001 RepID=UPI00363B3DE5
MTAREFDSAPATATTPAASDTGTGSAFITVPGVRNLRDAGGTGGTGGLRPGRLYRSGSFHTLTPDGAQRLKALGLRTVIDLRSATELDNWPDLRHGLDHESVHLPTFPVDRESTDQPWPDNQADLYLYLPRYAGPSIAAVIRRLIAPGALPALVHCAVGKDRTGLTVAVLQSLLGATEAEITADFLLSNAGLGLLDGPTPYVDETGTERISRPITAALLRSSLDWIRQNHGSVEGFVRAAGVTDDEVAALRAALGDGQTPG